MSDISSGRKRAESGFQSAQDAVGVEARVGYFQRGTNERHQRLIYNRLASVLEHGYAAFCKRGQHRADIRSFVAHDNCDISASVFACSEHSFYMRRGIGTLAADIGRRDYRYAVARCRGTHPPRGSESHLRMHRARDRRFGSLITTGFAHGTPTLSASLMSFFAVFFVW